MRSPIRWFGGKGKLVSKLARLVPNKWNSYIEPFFGGGSLFFRLPKANVETINDLDKAVMGFYKVLQSEDGFKRFYHLAQYTVLHREIFFDAKNTWEDEEDEVVRAWKWWYLCRCSFSVDMAAFGTVMEGGALSTSMQRVVDILPKIHERLKEVQFECTDALYVIERYARNGSFIYCDPPYMAETRVNHEYDCEMSYEQHEQLLDLLLSVPGKIMLSGYDSELYRKLDDNGWSRVEFDVSCNAVGRTKKSGLKGEGIIKETQGRTEVVWRNYVRADEVQSQLSIPF